jgi:actin cytoskeleton-regulatory complex protein SLA1
MAFIGVYKAVYSYTPQSEDELAIKEGDILMVLEKGDEDWWKAKKKADNEDDPEEEGHIPHNYVEPAAPIAKAKALYDYTRQTDEELSFADESILDVYDTTDPDWTLVGANGEFGFAPSNYIEISEDSAEPAPAPAAPPMPARTKHVGFAEPEPEPDSDPEQLPTPQSNASPDPSPAAALADILAKKSGGAGTGSGQRAPISPPPTISLPPRQPQYTPEESDEEQRPPPPKPQRPQSIASPPSAQYASPRSPGTPMAGLPSPPPNRPSQYADDDEDIYRMPMSPSGFHLYNIHEMVSHMGKNKKMPMTLGINIPKGLIMISPEKSRDGPQKEWTAEKLTHYSIEGKHVFMELVKPSKSIDFHAGAKDTAQEIVSYLGELAGAARAEGLREVLAAGSGTSNVQKKGVVLYDFMAQGDDEVTVGVGDEVLVLDDSKSDEWWNVRRLKNGKEGVVPSSYVEITGSASIPGADSRSGINAGKSVVEQNRLEEERLARELAKAHKTNGSGSEVGPGLALPQRQSSLMQDSDVSRGGSKKERSKDGEKGKSSKFGIDSIETDILD